MVTLTLIYYHSVSIFYRQSQYSAKNLLSAVKVEKKIRKQVLFASIYMVPNVLIPWSFLVLNILKQLIHYFVLFSVALLVSEISFHGVTPPSLCLWFRTLFFLKFKNQSTIILNKNTMCINHRFFSIHPFYTLIVQENIQNINC